MSNIHPTAMIAQSASIDPSVLIGPYCIIGDNVNIGENTVLHSHVVIGKNTKIGRHNEIFQFASLGSDPQDLKYAGEETFLEIGDDNRIREACTFHRGTGDGGSFTKIGNNNLFMVNTHIAHDCVVGNNNVLANNVGIAGHVHIGNSVVVGGQSGIHQFCRIDDYSMVAAGTIIVKDVMAFAMVSGNPARTVGLNKEGMRRKKWSPQTIDTLMKAYHIVFRSGLVVSEAVERLEKLVADEPKIQMMIHSLRQSRRGMTR